MRPAILPRGRTQTTLAVAALAVTAGIGVGYSLVGVFPRPAATGPLPPAPAAPDRIVALGRLDPAGGVVSVSAPPGDRIAKLYPLAPGTYLMAGDPVAELASRADRLLDVQFAEALLTEAQINVEAAGEAGSKRIAAADAELAQAKASAASDRAATRAKLDALKVQADAAAREVARLRGLKEGGAAVTDGDVARADLLRDRADAELAAAEALGAKSALAYEDAVRTAQARLGAARADRDEALARPPLKSAVEKLQLAKQLAARTIVRAPIQGTVLSVFGREGRTTGTEPILQMAALTDMTAVAEVPEADIPQLADWLKAGPVAAEVTGSALAAPLAGAIRSDADVPRVVARNQLFPPGPREDAERRVVAVTVHIDGASTAAAGRFVGLQVTVVLTPTK